MLLYDVAPLGTGGLLVAARSDSAAPGAEGGALVLSEVGPDGSVREEKVICRIDTLDEVEYFRHGGILQYVLRSLVKQAA